MKNLVICLIALFFSVAAFASDLDFELISKTAFGRAGDVELLLEKGANPNALNPVGQSVLIIAAARDDEQAPKIVETLLGMGANFNLQDANGDDAVIMAVKSGHAKSLKHMLELLPAMTRLDRSNRSLLQLAEIRGDEEIIALVKQAIFDENARLKIHQSDDNFRRLVKQYTQATCGEGYLNFYLKLGDEKYYDDDLYEGKLELYRINQSQPLAQLNRFFSLPKNAYKQAALKSQKAVVAEILQYEKQFERKLEKIGTFEDVEKRCDKISTSLASRIKRKIAK